MRHLKNVRSKKSLNAFNARSPVCPDTGCSFRLKAMKTIDSMAVLFYSQVSLSSEVVWQPPGLLIFHEDLLFTSLLARTRFL